MPWLKTSDSDLVTISLPSEGEWVKVKAKLGRDDERSVTRLLLTGQRVEAGKTLETFDLGAIFEQAVFATFEVAIKAWSSALPITPANIRSLDDESVQSIRAALEALYEKPRTDDESKNSGASGAATP